MGSWGIGVWSNDDALDLLSDLGKRPTKRKVLGLLRCAKTPLTARNASTGECMVALCAADLVAAAAGKPPTDAPPDVAALELSWTPTAREIAAAADAVEMIVAYSDLAELRGGSYATLASAYDDLRARLGAPPLAREQPPHPADTSEEPTEDELESAIDAMRAGLVRTAALRYSLEPIEDDIALLARATRPGPAAVDGRSDHVAIDDLDFPLHAPRRVPSMLALLQPLWRMLQAMLIADRWPPLRFAQQLLDVLMDLTAALETLPGREDDSTGAFTRAFALAHAAGVWSVANVERAAKPPRTLATAVPLLVLARYRARLRENWDASLDLAEAAHRMPAWHQEASDALDAVSKRADALADLLATAQNGGIVPRGGKIEIGTLLLQKSRAVTVALAVGGPHVVVASFADERKPYIRVAPSFVTPLETPASLGRVLLGIPADVSQMR